MNQMTCQVLGQGVTVRQECQPPFVFLLYLSSKAHPGKSSRRLAELAEQPLLGSAIIKMNLLTKIFYKLHMISFLLSSKKINISSVSFMKFWGKTNNPRLSEALFPVLPISFS